jgi:hypothetical protein
MPGRVLMTETLTATIVSNSQSGALGGSCAAMPPVDIDAGLVPPGITEAGGFDAVRACGTLTEALTSDPAPTAESDDAGTCAFSCNSCVLTYAISGDRK